MLSSRLPAPAQTPPCRNLMMEGGGSRGTAYGGALQELARQGVLARLTRVGGPRVKRVSAEQKARLLESGRQGVQAFLEKRN